MLKETKIDDTFTLVNAYSLKTEDKIRLEDKYDVDPHFFKYIDDSSEIPRFRDGSKSQQSLFVLDIPVHHGNTTTPISVVIDDNTSIVVFTNKDTKYVIPIISRLLNENIGVKYSAQDVALDTVHELANVYLDKIRGIDKSRIKDKALLKDKSKHRNASYIDHLSYLRTLASGYVYSLASDYSLLCSIREIMDSQLTTPQRRILRDDIIEYRQAKQEATFCFRRVRAILRSFSMKVNMGNSRKLAVLTCVSFPISIFSMVTSFYGMNLGSQGIALPFAENWLTASSVGIVFMAFAAIFVYFFIFYKK